MSSRQVVTITCDWCAHLNVPEVFAVSTVTGRFDRDSPRQIDLCDQHAAAVDVLRAVLRLRGVRPDADLPLGVVRCEICGQPCKGGTGLASHQRAKHGTQAA